MSHAHSHANTVSSPVLVMAAGLVAVSLLLTAAATTGLARREAVPADARAERGVAARQVRELVFADRADGAVRVSDAATGAEIALIGSQAKSSGFIRGVLRGLARDRHMRGIGSEPPFGLTLWQDGSLSLTDRATRRTIELGAFGPDNRAAFAALLAGGER